jgi:hypothetical protein
MALLSSRGTGSSISLLLSNGLVATIAPDRVSRYPPKRGTAGPEGCNEGHSPQPLCELVGELAAWVAFHASEKSAYATGADSSLTLMAA